MFDILFGWRKASKWYSDMKVQKFFFLLGCFYWEPIVVACYEPRSCPVLHVHGLIVAARG